jgi:hypothetical protein
LSKENARACAAFTRPTATAVEIGLSAGKPVAVRFGARGYGRLLVLLFVPPTRTSAATTMRPKATEARRVIKLAVELMDSSNGNWLKIPPFR